MNMWGAMGLTILQVLILVNSCTTFLYLEISIILQISNFLGFLMSNYVFRKQSKSFEYRKQSKSFESKIPKVSRKIKALNVRCKSSLFTCSTQWHQTKYPSQAQNQKELFEEHGDKSQWCKNEYVKYKNREKS